MIHIEKLFIVTDQYDEVLFWTHKFEHVLLYCENKNYSSYHFYRFIEDKNYEPTRFAIWKEERVWNVVDACGELPLEIFDFVKMKELWEKYVNKSTT